MVTEYGVVLVELEESSSHSDNSLSDSFNGSIFLACKNDKNRFMLVMTSTTT